MTNKKNKIGVFTSGGDAPGMNACIRAVVRTAQHHGMEVLGFLEGYDGILDQNYITMDARSVSGILNKGGSILKCARCDRWMKDEFRKAGAKNLDSLGVTGLVGIGGNGTFMGLDKLMEVWKGKVVGTPGTIDNDCGGTSSTIGFDTAINTAMELVDKIKDTASSHNRSFLIEVMGRNAGDIGLAVGIATGAEEILIPETPTDLPQLYKNLTQWRAKGKKTCIIIVSEGDEEGGGFEIKKKLEALGEKDLRVTILGHVQRGGSPTCRDRILASSMGVLAVESIIEGKTGFYTAEVQGKITLVPLKTSTEKNQLDPLLIKTSMILI